MEAVSGVDIGPMTFGELSYAVKAKADFEWSRASSLMALIANCHSRRVFKAEHFYRPQLRTKRRSGGSVESLHALKALCIQKV